METSTSRHLVLVEAYRLREDDVYRLGSGDKELALYPDLLFDVYDGYKVHLMPIGTGTRHFPTPIDYDIEGAGTDLILEDTWEDVKKMLPEVKPGEWARVLTVWEFVAEKWPAGEFGGGPWEYETYEYPIGKLDIDEVLALLDPSPNPNEEEE